MVRCELCGRQITKGELKRHQGAQICKKRRIYYNLSLLPSTSPQQLYIFGRAGWTTSEVVKAPPPTKEEMRRRREYQRQKWAIDARDEDELERKYNQGSKRLKFPRDFPVNARANARSHQWWPERTTRLQDYVKYRGPVASRNLRNMIAEEWPVTKYIAWLDPWRYKPASETNRQYLLGHASGQWLLLTL